ncbi:hypothetical protein BH10ACI1_BH10ACI1_27240 [soil metagenome]
MRFFTNIRLLLTAIWLGAAVFLSVAVAPSAFGILRAREVAGASEIAGAIVNQTLGMVNYGGLIIGAILLLSSFVATQTANRFGVWTERFFLFVLTATCAVGQFVIGSWMALIRLQIGKPIEEVAADDPLRLQFDALHKYSVWVLLAGIIAALLAFFVISRKSDTTVTVGKKDEFNFDKI